MNRIFASRRFLLVSAVLCLFLDAGAKGDDDVRPAVVRVATVQRVPALTRPWLKQATAGGWGSGVVIDGERILTNAHVVTYASQIYVQPFDSSTRYTAEAVAVSPDMDLAILKIQADKKDAFFRGRKAVAFAENLPSVQDELIVYGYPVGGHTLRPAAGTVSRIEYALYDYDGAGLRIEINAAVNPGASGGPAFHADPKRGMVGLVSGFSAEGQDIGYVTPVQEIAQFLQDIEDKTLQGKPQLEVHVQALENDALRAKLQLPDDLQGVLVSTLEEPASQILRVGDVITHVGKTPIDNVGMIQLDETDIRVSFQHLVSQSVENGALPLTIYRDASAQSVAVPVRTPRKQLVRYLKGERPGYFVWGPFCFSTASGELVDAISPALASTWSYRRSPLLTRRTEPSSDTGEELVMVTAVLPHQVIRGYSSPAGQVVSHINGNPVRNLRHLVELLRKANEKEEKFVEFKFADRYVESLVFDRKEVLDSMEELLSDNGIRQLCSDELVPIWKGSQLPVTQPSK